MAFAIAMGVLVGAVQRGHPLAGPLAFAGTGGTASGRCGTSSYCTVRLVLLVAVPFGVVTLIGPVVAPAGTVVEM